MSPFWEGNITIAQLRTTIRITVTTVRHCCRTRKPICKRIVQNFNDCPKSVQNNSVLFGCFDTNILFSIKTNSSACVTDSSSKGNTRDICFRAAVNFLPIADAFSSNPSLLKENAGMMIRSFQVNFYLWARFRL